MTTLGVAPSYPIPGRKAAVTFTLTEIGSNFVRVWCTAAPDGSEYDKTLKSSAASSPRFEVYEGDGGSAHQWFHTFDKGGTYTFAAQEYTKGGTFGGGYQGDTRGAPSETPVGSEATLTLEIGRKFTQTVGASPDTATLVFWLFGSTIRATTLALHGQVTPAIINPTTPRARTALGVSGVTAALSALSGVTATTALGTISSFVSDYVSKFNAHIILTAGSVHAAADADNTINAALGKAPTPQSLASFVTQAIKSLRQHETNDSGTGIGSAATDYHTNADMLDLPVVRGVSDTDSAYAALGDLYRAYEAHRVNTSAHGASDTTNGLSSLGVLLTVHRRFFEALAAVTPSVPAGDSSGAALLRNWGFKE